MTVAKEPFTGESSKQAVKPLRREGRSVSAALYARVQFCLRKSHARPRVQQAPGLPCALNFEEGKRRSNLGRSAPREREIVSTSLRAQRSNPPLRQPRYGLLRCARNDGEIVVFEASAPQRLQALEGQALRVADAGQIEFSDEGGGRFAVAIGQRHDGIDG